MADTPLDQLRAARFEGEQALYTTAVKLLSDRPAVPDDLAGLVARARYMVGNPSARDGYDEGASEMIRSLANAIEALDARDGRCFDFVALTIRPEAEVRAEAHAAGMREAADVCIGETLIVAPEGISQYKALDSYRAQIRSAILAAIPLTPTPR